MKSLEIDKSSQVRIEQRAAYSGNETLLASLEILKALQHISEQLHEIAERWPSRQPRKDPH